MKKINSLYLIIFFLIAINIGTLILSGFKKNDRKNPKPIPPHEILIRQLNFTQEQENQLKNEILVDESELALLSNQLKFHKKKLFNYAKREISDNKLINQSTDSIAYYMKEIDKRVYKLLITTRKTCTTKQKKKFDKIFEEIFNKEGRKKHMFQQE